MPPSLATPQALVKACVPVFMPSGDCWSHFTKKKTDSQREGPHASPRARAPCRLTALGPSSWSLDSKLFPICAFALAAHSWHALPSDIQVWPILIPRLLLFS